MLLDKLISNGLFVNGGVAVFEDPLKKREQFAVNLRKMKTNEIIQAKRKRTQNAMLNSDNGGPNTFYRGAPEFEENHEMLDRELRNMIPEIFNNQSVNLTIVSLLNFSFCSLNISKFKSENAIMKTIRL